MKKMFKVILGLSLVASHAWAVPTNLEKSVDDFISGLKGESKKAARVNPKFREQLVKYINFLHMKNDKDLKKLLGILAKSSTQFLFCAPADWECLEKSPMIPINTESRRDTSDDLGKPVDLNEPLNMEYFFTRRWTQIELGLPQNTPSLAQTFGEKISKHAVDGLYMAIYGMDAADGSMKPVYDAIKAKVNAGIDIKAVLDVTEEKDPNNWLRTYDVVFDEANKPEYVYYTLADIDFSYLMPKSGPHMWAWGRPAWMDQVVGMDPTIFVKPVDRNLTAQERKKLPKPTDEAIDAAWIAKMPNGKNARRIAFQYKDSPRLIDLINTGIDSNEAARARIEFPFQGIMHNKFAVMKDGNKMSVWSGTTNVADTCMGSENNSNMAILIHNNEIAKTFLGEFSEMYEMDPTNKKLTENAPTLITGRYKESKRPNTKRYFKFADGHEMKVHFSPTDDGEHRAILPLIHSSQSGDTLRISMFGSGGIEGVRALQAAAARGVKIFIVLDNFTGSGKYSWIKHTEGNLMEANPYADHVQFPIEIRLNNWDGLNHHKSATLTRANGKVEYISIGSQNWSRAGNDINDENMVTIRRLGQSIAAGEAFNEQFDKYMRPLSLPIALDSNGKVVILGKEKPTTVQVEGEVEEEDGTE